jgi:hypothetical protein
MTPVEHAEQMLRSAEQDYEASKRLAQSYAHGERLSYQIVEQRRKDLAAALARARSRVELEA